MKQTDTITRTQKRLFHTLCDNGAALGKAWFKIEKPTLPDDPQQFIDFFRNNYFKEHNIHQKSLELMKPEDREEYKEWYTSLSEEEKTVHRTMCENAFMIEVSLNKAHTSFKKDLKAAKKKWKQEEE